MRNIMIGILLLVAVFAGLLLYIGDDAALTLTSSATSGPLKMAPITLSWQAVIVILALTVMGLLALWTFLGWLWKLPSKIKSGSGIRRRNKALDAMEAALLAGADGDQIKARRKAEKARELVKSPALGRIISAQAAEASGDSEEAITHYRAMLDDEKTEATGRRGLAQQLLATGDLDGAIEQAGEVYAKNKNAQWAFDTLFKAQVADYRWEDAIDTVRKGLSRGHVDKEVGKRRLAVLETANASELLEQDQEDKAREVATLAAVDTPTFSPGVALAAKLLGDSGSVKRAGSIIEKAWAQAPHPALALSFKDVFAEESERTRQKRLDALVKANPEHRESLILQAETALEAGDGVKAWASLSPLIQKGEPSARLCLLAARAETMLNNKTDAALWTEKAAVAPSEPDWSDLDPEGSAFNYTANDWRRMVHTFGEKGELIHPRFETGAGRRSVLPVEVKLVTEEAETAEPSKEVSQGEEVATPRQPDDPGVIDAAKGDDLALRLDSLLGDNKKGR